MVMSRRAFQMLALAGSFEQQYVLADGDSRQGKEKSMDQKGDSSKREEKLSSTSEMASKSKEGGSNSKSDSKSESQERSKSGGASKKCLYICNLNAEDPFQVMKKRYGEKSEVAEGSEKPPSDSSNRNKKMRARREYTANHCECAAVSVVGSVEAPIAKPAAARLRNGGEDSQDNFGDAIVGAMEDVFEFDYGQAALDGVDIVVGAGEDVGNWVGNAGEDVVHFGGGLFNRRKLTVSTTTDGKARIDYEIAVADLAEAEAVTAKVTSLGNWAKVKDTTNAKLVGTGENTMQLSGSPVGVATVETKVYSTPTSSAAPLVFAGAKATLAALMAAYFLF